MSGWKLMIRSLGMHFKCRGMDNYLRSACTTWISSLILLDQACSQRCTCMRSRWKRICMLLSVTSYLLSDRLDADYSDPFRPTSLRCSFPILHLPNPLRSQSTSSSHDTTRPDKIVYSFCQSLAPRSETWKLTRQCRL